MKKTSLVILSLAFAAALLAPLTTTADQFMDFTYISDGTAITYTGYTGGGSDVTIPETVEGLPVAYIGRYAFYDRRATITNVIVPDSVTTIESGAFFGCTGLVGFKIPDSVTVIMDFAFAYCSALLTVSIPDGITSIGPRAFGNCTSITNVIIPQSVTSIGSGAFGNCTSLLSITIPGNVNIIGAYAFHSCTSLTSVTIPASVTTIGDYAFAYCDSLTSVFFAGPSPFHYDFPVFDSSPATIYYLPAFAPYWPSYFGTRPTKLWNPAFTGTALAAGAVSCTVTGSPPIPIAMEATTNLAAGPWVRLCTTNLTNNSITLHDSDSSSHPARFYRIIGP